MTDPILVVSRVRKSFGSVLALDDVSLAVERRSIVGLLGPNGAGKTTLMRVAVKLIHADAGTVTVGASGRSGSPARVGGFVERPAFYPYLTARRNLEALAMTSGLPISDARRQAEGALSRVGLADAADRKAGEFSAGMRQRLGVAAALIGDPEILILDEPSSGLDPAGAADMRRLLAGLREEGVAVLVSTHLLTEVEQVCDVVAIVNRGRLVAYGPIASLREPRPAWRLEFDDLGSASRAAAALGTRFHAIASGAVVLLTGTAGDATSPLEIVAPLGLLPREVSRVRPSLEEVYLELTASLPPAGRPA